MPRQRPPQKPAQHPPSNSAPAPAKARAFVVGREVCPLLPLPPLRRCRRRRRHRRRLPAPRSALHAGRRAPRSPHLPPRTSPVVWWVCVHGGVACAAEFARESGDQASGVQQQQRRRRSERAANSQASPPLHGLAIALTPSFSFDFATPQLTCRAAANSKPSSCGKPSKKPLSSGAVTSSIYAAPHLYLCRYEDILAMAECLCGTASSVDEASLFCRRVAAARVCAPHEAASRGVTLCVRCSRRHRLRPLLSKG